MRGVLYAIIVVSCGVLYPALAHASYIPLVFTQDISEINTNALQSYMQEHKALNISADAIEIAKIDLNGDHIEEIVLRDKLCAQKNAMCAYTVLAQQHIGQFIALASLEAKEFVISTQKTAGIHDIVVYNALRNDYTHNTYVWNPVAQTYKAKE